MNKQYVTSLALNAAEWTFALSSTGLENTEVSWKTVGGDIAAPASSLCSLFGANVKCQYVYILTRQNIQYMYVHWFLYIYLHMNKSAILISETAVISYFYTQLEKFWGLCQQKQRAVYT